MNAHKPATHPDSRQHLHYVHVLDYSMQERIVGLFVLGGLGLLFLALLFNQHSVYLFEDTFELKARVNNAEGISTSTRVRASGVEIGRISDVHIDQAGNIIVTLQIRERFHELVRSDSQAKLNSMSMFGATSIDVIGGSPTSPPIADGGRIHLQDSKSINALIGEFLPVVQNLADSLNQLTELNEGGKTVRQMMEDITASVNNLRTVSAQLSQGQGLAGRLLHDQELADQFAHNFALFESFMQQTEHLIATLQPTLHNADVASRRIDPLLQQMQALQNDVAAILKQVRGELDSVPGIAQDTRRLLEDGQRSINAARGLWPLSGAMDKQDTADREAHDQHTLPIVE